VLEERVGDAPLEETGSGEVGEGRGKGAPPLQERRGGGEGSDTDKRGEEVGARGGEGGAWRSTGKREGRSTTLAAPRLRGGARGRAMAEG